jgi:ABC-type lipoprotein export system ATPase subunit
LVLGNEPKGEVDTETAGMLLALLRRINRECRVTFLIVTHALDLLSRPFHARGGKDTPHES